MNKCSFYPVIRGLTWQSNKNPAFVPPRAFPTWVGSAGRRRRCFTERSKHFARFRFASAPVSVTHVNKVGTCVLYSSHPVFLLRDSAHIFKHFRQNPSRWLQIFSLDTTLPSGAPVSPPAVIPVFSTEKKGGPINRAEAKHRGGSCEKCKTLWFTHSVRS